MSASLAADPVSQHVVRLQLQAQLYDPLTRRLLLDAGVRPGQRVLDLGGGAGDVALLAAELVGPAGSVVSVDINPERVAYAQQRCARAGLSQVRCVQADLDELNLDETFDAVVARFVLRDVGDAAGVLASAARLAPGGVVVAQEKLLDLGVRSVPAVELVARAVGWMSQTRQLVGVDTRTGARLPAMFQAAGLPAPVLGFEAPVQAGRDGVAAAYLTETLRGMLGLTLGLGIATPDEVEIDTLTERITASLHETGLLVLTPVIGAWSRVP
jgi:precorrin-6B methylase 2